MSSNLATNQADQPSVTACKSTCAPSPGGCARCQSLCLSEMPVNTSAIVLGPKDVDAYATLRQALAGSTFDCAGYGPLLVVSEVRNRLSELAALLSDRLSPYTLRCIQSAYLAGGSQSFEAMLGAMSFAMPLAHMLLHIEHEWVRTALKENWLLSVFHPIINAKTGTVFANEALLRARNPHDNQIIGAGPIISACEKLNITHQLDQRARQCAIGAAAQHLPVSSRVFINFLPNTIYDPEICLRTTMEAASANNVAMDRLVFEVVETEKIPDMANLQKILQYYQERGVGTAIDDMGAGYTGVEYITALKPDFVKLDREFVLLAEQQPQDRAAMDTMIATAHRNNAKVIAEGIETVAQMEMCVNSGVDFLQGFLFARPACPPQEVRFPGASRQAA